MKVKDIIVEGGWGTTKTQSTVLHPHIVGTALKIVDQFVRDFNSWLAKKRIPPVRRGHPTGSSAYHETDVQHDPEKIYGDIDLQMIGVESAGQSHSQFSGLWNNLADEFINTGLDYVTVGNDPGHPIFQIGPNQYVQIDFMWHPERLAHWGRARATPEHGVKGLLTGNMYSVLGELLGMSIQHAGVQLKVVDGQPVPFSKQKGTSIVTISTNPETFILDLFKYLARMQGIRNPRVDPELKKSPGVDVNDIKISRLVNGVRGFAASCELNGMFGHGVLLPYSSAQDFINKFWQRYEGKAMADVAGKKRDKAATTEAQARAEADRQKILSGLEYVRGFFS